MRRVIILFLIVFLLFITCKENNPESEPELNPYIAISPWGITFDGENLWVTDNSLGMIYRLDLELNLEDSFSVSKPYIRGITFLDDKLWIVSDSSVGDSIGAFFHYDKYYSYGIDRSNGTMIDSILICLPHSSMPDGNFLWGIGVFNSNLYISYNGGWGDCMLELNPQSKEMKTLCCAHPLGFTVINDTLWCARYGSSYLVPIRVLADGTNEMTSLRYELGFSATDLTYDGEDVWVVDRDSCIIRKITDLR